MTPIDVDFKPKENVPSVLWKQMARISPHRCKTQAHSQPVFCQECISIMTVLMLVDRAWDCCEEMMCANAVSATAGCWCKDCLSAHHGRPITDTAGLCLHWCGSASTAAMRTGSPIGIVMKLIFKNILWEKICFCSFSVTHFCKLKDCKKKKKKSYKKEPYNPSNKMKVAVATLKFFSSQ